MAASAFMFREVLHGPGQRQAASESVGGLPSEWLV